MVRGLLVSTFQADVDGRKKPCCQANTFSFPFHLSLADKKRLRVDPGSLNILSIHFFNKEMEGELNAYRMLESNRSREKT